LTASVLGILGTAEVDDLTNRDTGVFVDVEKVFKAHFTSLRGSSIKKVAPLFGFRWRVDDPGGAVSQTYLATVHTATDANDVAAAKQWLLSYNGDDAAAMAAIRDGMRAWRPND
jgi:predicted RecB family nuclease